jgi:hypothetical protein
VKKKMKLKYEFHLNRASRKNHHGYFRPEVCQRANFLRAIQEDSHKYFGNKVTKNTSSFYFLSGKEDLQEPSLISSKVDPDPSKG